MMNQEFETQVLDVDKEEIIEKLRKLGAKEEPEVLQKRWIFDIDPCTVESTGEWIRLRKIGGKKPTMTYKNKSGKGLDQTQELEVEVGDFEKAAKILLNMEGKDVSHIGTLTIYMRYGIDLHSFKKLRFE